MSVISQVQVNDWLKGIAAVMSKDKDYLSQLDAAIGDADHGINMDRGFQKVLLKTELFDGKDIGAILKDTGMTLISSVGGASGPLYGKFFMQMGMALKGKMELNLADLCEGISKGLGGVKGIGKASVGDKTMVDVWSPVVESLNESVNQNETLEIASTKMVEAAEVGLKSTINLIARKGRASYLGERSIGHQDPGATSSCSIVKVLQAIIVENK
ncbi:dihydroxyacetone kinase subunit DhaL [Ancylomarina sp. 16SWW S1-10-2]|uniref:dihydroxyacetone kinase subunit DhaL n=1 Tax=Ancylomarina sp. 16SWW S1-10-2 TaxID=2499681 RepID=UPI0012AEA909|nr:dihydroxyacetone kinase subunit DhaL [Ancylomarina sp. 16SWW S1-10-2]MRT92765.1 dihydroxyacetone kinase subunit L [Ancylomarina sp. 16SWW S1-10-2]